MRVNTFDEPGNFVCIPAEHSTVQQGHHSVFATSSNLGYSISLCAQTIANLSAAARAIDSKVSVANCQTRFQRHSNYKSGSKTAYIPEYDVRIIQVCEHRADGCHKDERLAEGKYGSQSFAAA